MKRLLILIIALGSIFNAQPTHVIVRGVALLDWSHMEDLSTLGVQNFYGWGNYCAGRANCLNMDRDWTLPVSACDQTLLLGNEPTNPEPAGHPIDASVAASVTVAVEAACPDTQIIATNIHIVNGRWGSEWIDEVTWLNNYLWAYQALTGHGYGSLPHADGRFDLIGLHAYCYHPYDLGDGCIDRLLRVESQVAYLGHFWITETGIPQYLDGALGEWQALLHDYQLDPRIDRVYAWTNRCQCGDYMDMVGVDGTLTPYGQAFADWQPVSWQVALPDVSSGAVQGYP